MAESNPIATVWDRLRHPIQSVRSNLTQGANEWRAHPIQEALQRLIGVGTGLATANPVAGRAANSAADRFFSWLNNRGNNDFGPASGLQGITSPQGSDQSPISGMLGIPNYAGGNVGSTGANQYLTGNFGQQPQSASPGFQPINMDYGQNQQAPTPQSPNGGLPGITSANPYPQSGPAQSWHDSQGYDTGWRTGEGGTGLGGGWSTVDTGAEMSALSQLLSNAGGTWGDAARFNMTPEFGTEIMRADGTVRQRGGDSRLIERTGSNRPTTAQEFIRRNPDRWSQMLQQMRQGAGRG